MAVAPSSRCDAPKSARRRRRRDHLCSITAANHVARKQIAQATKLGPGPGHHATERALPVGPRCGEVGARHQARRARAPEAIRLSGRLEAVSCRNVVRRAEGRQFCSITDLPTTNGGPLSRGERIAARRGTALAHPAPLERTSAFPKGAEDACKRGRGCE